MMRHAVKSAGFFALIVLLALALQACDVSKILGMAEEEEQEKEKSEPEPEPDSGPVIMSYVLRAEDNDSLAFDVIGLVSETEVRVVLPYSIVNDNVMLTPTVKVNEGSNYSPQGTVGFRSSNFYSVSGSDGDTRGYTVYADVDPATTP